MTTACLARGLWSNLVGPNLDGFGRGRVWNLRGWLGGKMVDLSTVDALTEPDKSTHEPLSTRAASGFVCLGSYGVSGVQ